MAADIEAAFGVQRRMADWNFAKAQTWDDLLAAHEKWMRDYNFQKHMAHEKRDDGCHSPAAVLQWIKGVQPEPELVYQAFSALCETRRLNNVEWQPDGRHFSRVGSPRLYDHRYQSAQRELCGQAKSSGL